MRRQSGHGGRSATRDTIKRSPCNGEWNPRGPSRGVHCARSHGYGVYRSGLVFLSVCSRGVSTVHRMMVRPASQLWRCSGPHLPMLFLKQFRDVAYPDRACYQAIVKRRSR